LRKKRGDLLWRTNLISKLNSKLAAREKLKFKKWKR
jgi:hypothetical protein